MSKWSALYVLFCLCLGLSVANCSLGFSGLGFEIADADPDVFQDTESESSTEVSADSATMDAVADTVLDASEVSLDSSDSSSIDALPEASDSSVTICDSASAGTPISLSVTASQARAFSLYQDGAWQYEEISPAAISFAGRKFPGVLVSSGLNGIDLQLTGPTAQPHYAADTSSVTICSGLAFYKQPCDLKVAQDLWCTLYPAEMTGCDVKTAFASLGNLKSYVVSNPGNSKVVAMIRCK